MAAMAVFQAPARELSPASANLVGKWPTAEEFGRTWNAAQLYQWALSQRTRCQLTTDSPTLGTLAEGYGEQPAAAWLAAQLLNINGLFNIPVDRQIQHTQAIIVAQTWVVEYPRLKCSELWVFILGWFGGVYGKKLYGQVDLTELGADLNTYLHRRDQLAEEERKRRERAADQARRAADIAEFDRQLVKLRALRASPEWEKLTEERRESISGYLAFYDGYSPKTPSDGQNKPENGDGVQVTHPATKTA